MNRMRILRNLIGILCVVLLFSCAGMQAKQEAASEFDIGKSLFNRGRYNEAIPHFERATELLPDFGKAYLYLGRSYLNLGRWSEAIPPLRTAYRLSPGETKKEIADIIFDIILRKGSLIDGSTQSEILDLLRE